MGGVGCAGRLAGAFGAPDAALLLILCCRQVCNDPGFRSSMLSLIDRGFVYAIAHGGHRGCRELHSLLLLPWHDMGGEGRLRCTPGRHSALLAL